jgi:rod shape-determining protein MreC
VIVAALIALVQLDAAKTGKPSIISDVVTSTAFVVQSTVATVAGAARGVGAGIAAAPHLATQNAELREKNRVLRSENARLREALALAPEAAEIARAAAALPGGIEASTIGYDPENIDREITLDRGGRAGIAADDGVVNEDGVVGRIVSVTPLESTVLLVTDGASKVPAVVQRGRWWGIATGTNGRIRIEYISQDAKLRVGDAVVTGAGRSFRAGLPLGTIARVDHPDGALYQSALREPAVAFGRISRVIVVPRTGIDDVAPAPRGN